ncbi:dihydroorotate dehydrogenase electron transfer subunit [Culicoidibacter larvae]|uniref:Dihydroorotate dehydrogenase B (NAD(+)), electron transfer subunit n=2 Tax=Culicoidibacter larvae TaxID=2579976 RepID=A0A5R8QBS5_9FIRM|nr:dihydroorotate dehydrogenase electron transfer subunit [Culicoidibacter larvae]
MRLVSQKQLAKDVYLCVLEGDLVQQITAPGQFIQLQVPDHYLRRPISICDYDQAANQLTIIYKVFGTGTAAFAELEAGQMVSCLGPLGNGFDVAAAAAAEQIVLVGGGVGVPPLYGLAKALLAQYPQKKITAVLGFNQADDVFYAPEFAELLPTTVMTIDGSLGEEGTVIAALQPMTVDYIYSCGPTGMLRAIETAFPEVKGQVSLEERMACGFGACMACVCKTDNDKGYARVCLDGPVFAMGSVVYE